MEMEEKLNYLYREIAETVNEMIPETWEKFYFYAQISENGGGTYFFYNTKDRPNSFQYSVELPFKYRIDKSKFSDNKIKLFDLSEELRKVFEENGQELWYSFTMSLDTTGKFKMHYDYTNWFKTNYDFTDQMVIWKYKYLNEKPQDEELQKVVNKYLEEYPNNPI